ncbi:MAG TPA: His/Gly/Thr/Pro-type tRNA ligase C-terminal domain-containing protein, partial [Dehalococcoidia bacterium]|nr:His/Gly/Thr/Pro-type tRNA ligase C-terminal domain-containing protein [Dehalococcoidia bacterium]
SAAWPNLVAGANKRETHLRNTNLGRDWSAYLLTDIVLARAGDPCPHCEAALTTSRAIEMGHIFQLGTKYSEQLGATFLDAQGRPQPVIMGSYGIGIERLLAGVIEANHDERGIIWPAELAPYDVHLVALNPDRPGVTETTENVLADLEAAGLRVLVDDRDESPGVKFNDADLLGMPVRATVSPRNVEAGVVELRMRRSGETMVVPMEDALEACRSMLAGHREATRDPALSPASQAAG